MISFRKSLLLIFLLVLIGCAGPRQQGQPPPAAQNQQPPALPTAAPAQERPLPPPTATALISDDTAQEAAAADETEPAAGAETESGTDNPVEEVAATEEAASETGAADGSTTVATTNSAVPTGCPAEHFMNVQANPANAAYPTPQLTVTCTDEVFIVESNGIPNFEFVRVTPNDLAAQNYTWQIPLRPTPAAAPADVPLGGPVAVAVNGIPIFGPTESPNDDYADPYLDELLDYCNGHTAQRGVYHFHARPDCLFEKVDGQVGLVMGYAFDGYPILAPYLCQDEACASVQKVQSSWQRTKDVRNPWEANQYVEGAGDLDQCNGHTFADGSYAYFATDTFPYFLGCYHGQVTLSGPGGGNGQQGSSSVQAGSQGGQSSAGGPDLAKAAEILGISQQDLMAALGPPPPDFAAAAQKLGISEEELQRALEAAR